MRSSHLKRRRHKRSPPTFRFVLLALCLCVAGILGVRLHNAGIFGEVENDSKPVSFVALPPVAVSGNKNSPLRTEPNLPTALSHRIVNKKNLKEEENLSPSKPEKLSEKESRANQNGATHSDLNQPVLKIQSSPQTVSKKNIKQEAANHNAITQSRPIIRRERKKKSRKRSYHQNRSRKNTTTNVSAPAMRHKQNSLAESLYQKKRLTSEKISDNEKKLDPYKKPTKSDDEYISIGEIEKAQLDKLNTAPSGDHENSTADNGTKKINKQNLSKRDHNSDEKKETIHPNKKEKRQQDFPLVHARAQSISLSAESKPRRPHHKNTHPDTENTTNKTDNPIEELDHYLKQVAQSITAKKKTQQPSPNDDNHLRYRTTWEKRNQ